MARGDWFGLGWRRIAVVGEVFVGAWINVLFGAAHREGTLLSVTLLSLVVIVAVVDHARVEVVYSRCAVHASWFRDECDRSIDLACFAAATVVVGATTAAGAASASSAASSAATS